jgi:hypothetical protein
MSEFILMRTCLRCKFENADDALFCVKCGVHLDNADLLETLPTIDVIRSSLNLPSSKYDETQLEVGTLMLEIDGAAVIKPMAARITLGRRSELIKTEYLIDLTPFDAVSQGVSRIHAEFQVVAATNLMLKDLGSANGTMINGVALTPHELYRVHNGDQIQLGNLIAFVHYKAPGDSNELDANEPD